MKSLSLYILLFNICGRRSFFIQPIKYEFGLSKCIKISSLEPLHARLYNRDTFERSSIALDDFDQIVESIKIYKKLYKDTKIPLKFEVPAESPWPFNLHGLRLGKRLEKVLSQPAFFQDHNDKVEILKSVGFDPKPENLVDDWDIILDALQTYHRIYGDLRVSVKFVIPDEEPWPRLARNLKLGLRVASIRSAGRYVKDHPDRKAKLDEMGFEWRIREHSSKANVDDDVFDRVYDGLKTYKELIDEDIDSISIDFIVPPNSPWPKHLWELKLGVHVQAIRENDKQYFSNEEKAKKLIDLGLEPNKKNNDRTAYTNKRFVMVYKALQTYKELYGDLTVPQSFTVPATAPWPEDTWNLKLGVRVSAIRCQGVLITNYPERREMLTELGFAWDMQTPQSGKKKKNSLVTGSDGVGNDTAAAGGDLSLIEKEKKVEENLAKRKAALNLQKLEIENKVLSTKIESSMMQQALQDNTSLNPEQQQPVKPIRKVMKFDFSKLFEPSPYREVAAESIREYMQDREYSTDPKIRARAHFEGHLTPSNFNKAISPVIEDEDIEAMKKIGYRLIEFGKFNWNKFIQALEIYKNHYGHIDVPLEYFIDEEVIYSTEIGYDISFENMPLGEFVHSVRTGDVDGYEDTERRPILDNLGFVWGDDMEAYQRYRYVPMLIGLRLYKHLYGFAMPQGDFVVPDEPQWPYWMAHMPLGEWTAVARIQQKMIEKQYPDRKELLDNLGFLWWIPPGHIDPKYYQPLQ